MKTERNIVGFIDRLGRLFQKNVSETASDPKVLKKQIEDASKEIKELTNTIRNITETCKKKEEELERLRTLDKMLFLISTLLSADTEREIITKADIERLTAGAKLCSSYFNDDTRLRGKKEKMTISLMDYLETELWERVFGTNFECWENMECKKANYGATGDKNI